MNHRVTLRRTSLAASALFALAASAPAQIIAVHLKDEPKILKKYDGRVVMVNGKPSVLGEPKSSIALTEKGFTADPKVAPELWTADPGDPEIAAYTIDNRGNLDKGSKECILRMDWSHIQEGTYAAMVMRDETLPSLTKEYLLRRAQIDEYKEIRDELDRTTTEWAAAHVRVVSALEALDRWCRSTLWGEYAEKKLAKEIKKEARAHRGQAIRARHDKAMASLTEAEVPEKLKRLSEEISGGSDEWSVRETQHIRVLFSDDYEAAAIEEAMILGEEIIEGFRAEFVDPYLGEDFEDHIPDDLFHEFLYVPGDENSFVEYSKGYWGVDWSQNRAARVQMGGGRIDGNKARPFRNYRKHNEQIDHMGDIAHGIGHSIAGFHYGGPTGQMNQDWLSEAIGYYVSFNFLGRNTVTCKQFGQDPSGYVRRERKVDEGEKTVGEGRRELYNRVALEIGRPIERLAPRTLFEMDDADLAKAWSFFDYVARAEGKAGQKWLRAAAQASLNKSTFLNEWREAAAEALGVDPGRAFKDVEERWRAFAESFGDQED